MGANKSLQSRERGPTSSCNRRQHFNGKQRRQTLRSLRCCYYYCCGCSSSNRAIRFACEPGQTPSHLLIFLSTSIHPSIHPGSRGPYCVPGPGLDTENLTHSLRGRERLPPFLLPRVGTAGGFHRRKLQKAQARNPGQRRSQRRPDLGGRERASPRPRGDPCLALRWLRRLPCRSPPPALPSPARVEFGCYARGRRGYEGFESAQPAEWSSHLFPPPATGLNFCKFKLNGAFFCCLPEGACSPPRAVLGRERPPGAQLGASQRAGPETVRARPRRQGGGCGGTGDRGPGDLSSGSQTPDRAPGRPSPTSAAPGAPERRDCHSPRRNSGRGPVF